MRSLVLGMLLVASVVRAAPRGTDAPAEVKGKAWVVRASAPPKVQLGERVELEVVVEAQGGFHLNDDYPINFRPASTPEAAFERTRIDKKDVVLARCAGRPTETCRARVPAAFVAEADGSLRVGGTLAFSACDASQCLIEKVTVAATVEAARKR